MGICGIVAAKNGAPVESAAIERMVQTLEKEERSGTRCVSPEVGFGAGSRTDTASVWCSEQLVLACDADLLNSEELYSGLTSLPSAPNPASLLGVLYLRSGIPFLDQLQGSFAIALWDKRLRRLLLAVDRFGIRSLYYAQASGGICFGSRFRTLFASGRVGKTVNHKAIVNYLNFSVVPLPESAFEGVSRVSPGTYVQWADDKLAVRRYWDISYPEDARGSKKELASELLQMMDSAVRRASVGVPPNQLGCFLSGGTDSSSIVGLLSKNQGQPVNTFSIGFAEQRFDELHYAHIAAKHFDTNHSELIPSAEETYDVIPQIVDAYDEPFANSSAIPTYFCLRLAREKGIRVMLAGDGGDELFGGNERYRTHQVFDLYQRIPAALRQHLLEPLIFGMPISLGPLEKLRRYIVRSNVPNPERYLAWSFLRVFLPERVLAARLAAHAGGDLLACPRAYYDSAPAHSELNRLLYLDVKMTLGDNDLPKVVGMADLVGIDVRFPYLDHPLAEFSGRLPAHLKLSGLEKRYLFKRATRKLLPTEILNKQKHGFGLPIGLWIKEHRKLRGLAEDVLLDARTYQRGYFRREFVEELFALMDQDTTPYYGDTLWTLLVLELWHRQHVEGRSA